MAVYHVLKGEDGKFVATGEVLNVPAAEAWDRLNELAADGGSYALWPYESLRLDPIPQSAA